MKQLAFIFFISFTLLCRAQDGGMIKGIDGRLFTLKKDGDTIHFILVNGDIKTVKPVLIFCQGSQPIPLILKQSDGSIYFSSLTNFDYKKIAKEFHLVIISMPNTPVEMPENKLNKNYALVTDTSQQQSYSPAYLANNYAGYYVKTTKAVIDFLSQQKWADPKRISVFGHSQGSKVAVLAALNNPKVYKVGYSGGNPMGRIDQLIREQRQLAKEGKISAEESQHEIESIYAMWQQINDQPNALTTEFGDPNKTWTSFSKPLLNDLLVLNKPLYVCYGTEDITATFCDLLPIYFIREHKTNLTFKPYVGLEHNFFEVDANGRPIYEKDHWQQVMNDFITWVKE